MAKTTRMKPPKKATVLKGWLFTHANGDVVLLRKKPRPSHYHFTKPKRATVIVLP